MYFKLVTVNSVYMSPYTYEIYREDYCLGRALDYSQLRSIIHQKVHDADIVELYNNEYYSERMTGEEVKRRYPPDGIAPFPACII